MRNDREFGGYRGRGSISDVLRVIAVVLAVLVVLALALLFYAQRYLVYTSDGVHLELPPFLSFLQPDKADEGQDLDPSGVTFVEKEPEPEPVPEPEPPLAALQLPLTALESGLASQLLENAGANALVLEMKPPQGNLNWFSGAELAGLEGINAADRGINQTLREWNAGDVYTVARVSCLRDNTLPYLRRDLAVHASYGNWQDDRRTRWLNPAQPEVQTYLAELCGELAELGFDEILLDSCTYPTRGRVSAITNLDGAGREQTIQGYGGLLAQLKAVTEPYGTRLSALLDEPLPEEGLGGLTPEGAELFLSGMWLPGTEDAAPAADGPRLVYIADAIEAGARENQAVLLPDSPVTSPVK